MWWIDGKKIYVAHIEKTIEFIEDSNNITFPCDGFIICAKRDEKIEGYRFDERTKNLQKQMLPYFTLMPHRFFTEELFSPCPLMVGNVIINEIDYKDYSDISLILNCTILNGKKTLFQKFEFKRNIGVDKIIKLSVFNLNLLIFNHINLENLNISEKNLLLENKSLKDLFSVINNLSIEFKSFEYLKIGGDNSYSLHCFIRPDNHVYSEYINNLIIEEINHISFNKVNTTWFYPGINELRENIQLHGEKGDSFNYSSLYKDSQIEFEVKDHLKLSLVTKYDPFLDLISDLLQNDN